MLRTYWLVIDNIWHSIRLTTLQGRSFHQHILDFFIEIEHDNLEDVAFDPGTNWRMISVMLVTKTEHDVLVRYFGTHAQILNEMQEKANHWKNLE